MELLEQRTQAIESRSSRTASGNVAFAFRLLSDNELKHIRPKMLAGLSSIKNLLLSSNQLNYIANDTFSELPTLQLL